MIADDLPFAFFRGIHGAVVVHGEVYVIAMTKDVFNRELKLWKFNPDDLSWESSSLPFTINSNAVASSDKNKMFIYTAGSDNGFWEFNPVDQQWTQLASYPGKRRNLPTIFR